MSLRSCAAEGSARRKERSALVTVEHTQTVAPFRIAADAHRIGPHAHRPRLCRARTGKPSLSHYSLRQVCRGDIAPSRCTICCCRQLNCATSHARTTSDRSSKRTALRGATLRHTGLDCAAASPCVSRRHLLAWLAKEYPAVCRVDAGWRVRRHPRVDELRERRHVVRGMAEPHRADSQPRATTITPHGMYGRDNMEHLMHASLVASTRVTPSSAT